MRAVASLAAALAAAFSAPAAAQTEVAVEPIIVSFGGPGELFIDAREPFNMLEVATDPLEFANYDEYLDYLANTLNADVKDGSFDLISNEAGDVVYVDPDTADVLPAEDPVGMMIGGLTGFVIIDGMAHCVNPTLCNPEQNLTLAAMQAEVEIQGLGLEYLEPGWIHDAVEIWGSTTPSQGIRLSVKTVDVRPVAPWELRIRRCSEGRFGLCITVENPDNLLEQSTIVYEGYGCNTLDVHQPIGWSEVDTRKIQQVWRADGPGSNLSKVRSASTDHKGVEYVHNTEDFGISLANYGHATQTCGSHVATW